MDVARDQVRAERVEHIADLIRTMQFRYGETYKALAREWSLTYEYVRAIGAEAHELVRGEIVDAETVTVNVCVTLERVMARAYETADYGSAVAAAREWGRLAYAHADRAKAGASTRVSTKEATVQLLESLLEAARSSE